jgi:alkylation response protein AidB-like acyl-CoA dehydrogenase
MVAGDNTAPREIGEIGADPFSSELVILTQSNHAVNFELTSEQQKLQKAAIEFARRELNSNMIERDAQQVFSRDGWKRCASFGVQGMPVPKEYGGRDGDAIQIHGGAGFLTGLEFEREMRDSVESTLYSGTSEIQRNIIARGLRL